MCDDEKETNSTQIISKNSEFVSRRVPENSGEPVKEEGKKESETKKTMSSRKRTRCPCSKGVTIFLKNSNHSLEDTHDLLFKLVDNDCAKCMDRVLSQYVNFERV